MIHFDGRMFPTVENTSVVVRIEFVLFLRVLNLNLAAAGLLEPRMSAAAKLDVAPMYVKQALLLIVLPLPQVGPALLLA